MKKFATLLALIITSFSMYGQTSVYIRNAGVRGYVIQSASNTNPVVVQVSSIGSGLNPLCSPSYGSWATDCVVINSGVGATVGGNCVASSVNGIYRASYVDTTHFSLYDLAGNPVAANGPWCNGDYQGNGVNGASWGGQVVSSTLVDQPRGWFNGPNGSLIRKLALGTNNGLTSLIVNTNVATVVTSYNHGLTTGDKVGIWGSGNTSLNNSTNPYTVTVVNATTFTFPTSGVANGTYSNSNNTCGPLGTSDCLRISQLAWAGNIWYDTILNRWLNGWKSPSITYKHIFDGGSIGGAIATQAGLEWGNGAVMFLVDQSNQDWLNVAKYCVNNVERFGGVNFSGWEGKNDLGYGNQSVFGNNAYWGAWGESMCYLAARDYLTPAEKQTFADKMFNDVDWPSSGGCTKTNTPINEIVASGTGQAINATSITLSAGDAAPNGFYVNNVVMVGGTISSLLPGTTGLITAYDGTTKIATVTWNGTTPTSLSYTIYATMTISSTTKAAVATVTGYNTHFTTQVAAHDAIMGINVYGTSMVPEASESYVTSITNDTSMQVINGATIVASVTTPQIAWYWPQWKTGSCGFRWTARHWGGSFGSIPSVYIPNGGALTTDSASNSIDLDGDVASNRPPPGIGGNNHFPRAMAYMALDLIMADDDARAKNDFTYVESWWWDYLIRDSWNYGTGWYKDGGTYSFGFPMYHGPLAEYVLQNSLVNPPSMDTTGNLIVNGPLEKIYSALPDNRYSSTLLLNTVWPEKYGGDTGINALGGASQLTGVWSMDPIFILNSGSTIAKYLNSYNLATGVINSSWPSIYKENAWVGLISVDPRIGTADWTQQPTQYLFQTTSRSNCVSATGWPCPLTYRADTVVSRTGWTPADSGSHLSNPGLSNTHTTFMARSYWNEHDLPEPGSIRVYKVGFLLGNDWGAVGAAAGGASSPQADILDTTPCFGACNGLHTGAFGDGYPSLSYIARWAGSNSGSWIPTYGDASNRYVYAMADMAGAYKVARNRVWRHYAEFKKTGTEQIILQYDDIDTSNSPSSTEVHIHYPQNGELAVNLGTGETYNEGNTTCPLGGCAGLDTNRVILSQEDGGTTGNDPTRTAGLISNFLSPNTIQVRDDNNTYPSAHGHTHRVSLCGSSCGTVVNGLQALTVHRIVASGTPTLTTSVALNDSTHYVVQADDKVFGLAINGNLVNGFPAHIIADGTDQILYAGLTPAHYTLSINGIPTFSNFVYTGDNSFYLDYNGTGGTAVLAQSTYVAPSITTTLLAGGMKGVAYSFQIVAVGGDGAYTWAMTSGTLPSGLTFNTTTGLISGAPTVGGEYSITVRVTDATANSDTKSFTLVVGGLGNGMTISGGTIAK